jgi:hypothetical protein
VLEQRADNLRVPDAGGSHQDRLPAGFDVQRVGSRFEKRRGDCRVSVDDREFERRDAVAVAGFGVSAGGKQSLNCSGIVVANGPCKCGRAIWFRRVDGGMALEKKLDSGMIARLHSLDETGVRRRCKKAGGEEDRYVPLAAFKKSHRF